MFYKDYSAPCTNFQNYNVYSAHSDETWSMEQETKDVKCNTCHKKCFEAFMTAIYGNTTIASNCWSHININKK